MQTKAGVFSLNTTTGNQAISGLGFAPKAILFFYRKSNATGLKDTIQFGWGFAANQSPDEEWSMSYYSEDNLAASRAARGNLKDAAINLFDFDGTNVTQTHTANVTTWDSDGFTLNVSLNSPGTAIKIGYIAFGGSGVSAKVGKFTGSGVTGNQTISGLGIDPSLIFFGGIAAATDNAAGAHMTTPLGFAGKKGGQGHLTVSDFDAQATTLNNNRMDLDLVTSVSNSSSVDHEVAMVSMGTGQFIVNWLNAGTNDVYYMAIAGVDARVINDLSRTATGNFDIDDLGFNPKGIVILGSCKARNTTFSDGAEFSLGVSDGTNRVALGFFAQDNVADSNTFDWWAEDRLYKNYDSAQALEGDIDIVSLGTDKVTLNQTDADPAQYDLMVLVFGDPHSTIFKDTFTEPTSDTTLASHTPDIGTSWSVLNQVGGATLLAQAASDTLIGSGSLSNGAAYTADATYAGSDYAIEIDGVNLDSSDDMNYLLLRVQDANNLYALEFNTSVFRIYKRVTGTWTLIGTDLGAVATATSKIKFQIKGSTLKSFIDGVQQHSITDSSISATGKAGVGIGGFRLSGDDISAQELDNFIVYGFGNTYQQACNEVITIVDPAITTRITGKSFTEAVIMVDTINKSTSRIFTDVVTLVDTVAKQAQKTFNEAVAIVDTVSRVSGKVFSEAITLVDTVAKMAQKTFSEALALVDTLATHITNVRVFNETIILADSIVRATTKILTDPVTIVDIVNKQTQRLFSEIVTIADQAVQLVTVYVKSFSETILISDVLTKSLSRAFGEVVVLADSMTRGFFVAKTEVITVVDTFQRSTSKILTDTLTIVDSISKSLTRLLAETVTVVDNFTSLKVLVRDYSEVITVVDQTVKTEIAKNLTEVIAIADSITRSITRTLDEVISIVDTLGRGYFRVYQEAVVLVDGISRLTGKVFTEAVAIVDTRTTTGVFHQTFTEIVTIVDSVQKSAVKVLSDTISMVDSITHSHFKVRSFEEIISIGEYRVVPVLNGISTAWQKLAKAAYTWTKQVKSSIGWTKEQKPDL